MANNKKTAEELEQELAVANNELSTLQLTADGLTTQVDALKAELSEATGVIDGQAATIADLERQLSALQAAPGTPKTFQVGKETYEVQAGSFKFRKQTYTVAELLKDKKLQKELVEAGVGFLRKLD